MVPSELRNRLVHCGVHPDLTVAMAINAIRYNNKDECIMKANKFQGVNYYMPQKFWFERGFPCPIDQRLYGSGGRCVRQRSNCIGGRGPMINLSPEKGFFERNDSSPEAELEWCVLLVSVNFSIFVARRDVDPNF